MTEQEYLSIKGEIKTGDLFFTSSKALFSRLIRLITRANVSHVGIFVRLGRRLFIADSMEGIGCRLIPASSIYKNITLIGSIKYKVPKADLRKSILDDISTVEYDLFGAILSVLVDTKTAKSFCSEWVVKKLNLYFPALRRGVYPSDIANKLNKILYRNV